MGFITPVVGVAQTAANPSKAVPMMSWRRFWTIFLVVQSAGVSLSVVGIAHNFMAVLLGMVLLFPGSLFVTAQINLGSAALIVAVMLAINVVCWIALLRPMSQPLAH
jgi:hypothetical protein